MSGTGVTPEALAAPRTIFVGDVHGCAAQLEALLQAVAYRPGTDRLLLTGDLFTKGPDPVGVWEIVQALEPEVVAGNHELRVAKILTRYARSGDFAKPQHREVYEQLRPIAAPLLAYIRDLPLYIEDPRFLLLHAGLNPETGLAGSSEKELVSMRTWPPVKGVVGPRWHEAWEDDGRLIVFGHDAPEGLVQRRRADGSPYLIGLDTGCCYGGRLTAYLLEADALASVPGWRPPGWRPISGNPLP